MIPFHLILPYRGVQYESPYRRGEIGAATPGVDRRDEIGKRLPARVRNSLELVPKSGFHGNARAMARDAERMFDDFSGNVLLCFTRHARTLLA